MSHPLNDTTTTLNTGTGGDVMDESLVTQSDGVTEAKRPRVVPGGDDGSIQTFSDTGVFEETAADVRDREVVELMRESVMLQRRMVGLLTRMCMGFGFSSDDDEIIHLAEEW